MLKTCLILCCLCVAPLHATAQEIVHALAGTVTSIDATAKTITVTTDEGFQSVFKDATDSNVKIDFNRDLRAQTTTAEAFSKTGTRVIVYYFGVGTQLRAVSLENLGNAPVMKSSGTVLKLDRHKHLLTIKTASGSKEVFEIGPKTVAETSYGAIEGEKLSLEKGTHVRVSASPDGTGQTASFINAS